MSNFNTISAIMRSPWLIDQEYALGMLPWIASLINGTPSSAVPRSGAAEYEQPFFIDPSTMQRYNWYTKGDKTIPPKGSVAIIPINGPITKYDGGCGEPGSISRQNLVMEVDSRPELSGALYLYDTPGGQVSGTSSLASAIRYANKKSVAYVDDGMSASAGMWFLSASSEAYVSQATDRVGSIGAYMTLLDVSGYFEKLGIKLHEVYAPQSTDKNGAYKAAIKGNDGQIKEELRFVVDGFIDFVASRSELARANKDKWSTGKMFYADEAKSIGLIDGILPIEQAVQRVAALNTLPSTKIFSTNKNSKTMSFEKTLVAAKAEAFPVVEGGFLLTETDLNNLESNITASEAAATKSASDNKTLQDQTVKDAATIKDLQGQIEGLKKANAGTFTQPNVDGDDKPDNPESKNSFETSFDRQIADLKLN